MINPLINEINNLFSFNIYIPISVALEFQINFILNSKIIRNCSFLSTASPSIFNLSEQTLRLLRFFFVSLYKHFQFFDKSLQELEKLKINILNGKLLSHALRVFLYLERYYISFLLYILLQHER